MSPDEQFLFELIPGGTNDEQQQQLGVGAGATAAIIGSPGVDQENLSPQEVKSEGVEDLVIKRVLGVILAPERS